MGEIPPIATRLVSVEEIAAIWEAHGLGPVERVSATASGIRNECYVVNDELVVCFNTQDPGFAKFANEAAAFALLAKSDVLTRLRAIPERAEELFSGVAQGSLIHCDFHYENILQEHGRLSGLLDFEWALSGDPSYDFMTGTVREAMLPGSEEVFLQGYLGVRSLDDRHDGRLDLYRLLLALETAVTDDAHGDRAGAAAALAETMRRLEAVEQWLGPQRT